MNMDCKTMIVITGPTASGKSALAVDIARRLGTEVISADSRQIYRDIPIVTAAPTEQEMQGIRHHLIGILPLDAYFSASMFEEKALEIASDVWHTNDYVVVCGGSMMYVDALCNGIDPLPTVPEDIRGGLMSEWKSKGDEWLLAELQRLDPVHYSRVDRRNMKRVFHAVEVSVASGVPYSSLLTGKKTVRPFRIVKVLLEADREVLFSRINARVLDMVANGLEEEARRVYSLRALNSLNTVGLKEMFAWFDGVMGFDEAVARIQKNTRVYAKKQITWYRNDTDAIRFDISDSGLTGKVLECIM